MNSFDTLFKLIVANGNFYLWGSKLYVIVVWEQEKSTTPGRPQNSAILIGLLCSQERRCFGGALAL
jgi:hypothetical protein